MGSILASAIISKAKTIIQDTTNIRWQDAEHLGFLNDGQREVAMLRPDSTSRLAVMQMIAGTKQTIPSDGIAILKVIRNMGAAGTTPGQAIRMIPMDTLDSNVPSWHSASSAATTLHYMTDQRMPHNFYVYPPATGSTYVEILYGCAPIDVPSVTQGSGTYTQSTTVITVTLASHGYQVGSWVKFTATTGAGVSGTYQVQTVPTTGTFTLASTTSQTVTTSNCTIDGCVSVDDVFAGPLIDYVLFRAYAKDQDLAGNADRAMAHRKLFETVMAGKAQSDAVIKPAQINIKG